MVVRSNSRRLTIPTMRPFSVTVGRSVSCEDAARRLSPDVPSYYVANRSRIASMIGSALG